MIFSPKLVERYRELKAHATDCFMQMAGDVDAPVVLGGFPKSGLNDYVPSRGVSKVGIFVPKMTLPGEDTGRLHLCKYRQTITREEFR